MHRRWWLSIIALTLAIQLAVGSDACARQYTQTAFSPSPETTALITRNIRQAKQTVRVAAYSFTSQAVADALIDAHNNGVDVMVVVDKSNQYRRSHSIIPQLHEVGIPVRVNRKHSIMHNKYIVIDEKTLETGSFNYTANAEKRNAENVMVIRNNPGLAATYFKDWQRLWEESDDYNVGSAKATEETETEN